MVSAPTRTVAGLLLVCGAAAAARGDAIIGDFASGSAGAATLQADQENNPVGNPQFMFVEEPNGLDFSGSASTTYNDMGFVGTASSNWNHAYAPSSPGLGNPFSAAYMSGSAASSSTSDGLWWDMNSGFANSVIYFSVASDTTWTFAADVVGTTSGSGFALFDFFLRSADFTTLYGEATNFATGGESINDSWNLNGIIPAGDYLFFTGVGALQDYQFTPGSGAASIEVTNGVFTIPEPGTAALVALGSLALRRRRRY